MEASARHPRSSIPLAITLQHSPLTKTLPTASLDQAELPRPLISLFPVIHVSSLGYSSSFAVSMMTKSLCSRTIMPAKRRLTASIGERWSGGWKSRKIHRCSAFWRLRCWKSRSLIQERLYCPLFSRLPCCVYKHLRYRSWTASASNPVVSPL